MSRKLLWKYLQSKIYKNSFHSWFVYTYKSIKTGYLALVLACGFHRVQKSDFSLKSWRLQLLDSNIYFNFHVCLSIHIIAPIFWLKGLGGTHGSFVYKIERSNISLFYFEEQVKGSILFTCHTILQDKVWLKKQDTIKKTNMIKKSIFSSYHCKTWLKQ